MRLACQLLARYKLWFETGLGAIQGTTVAGIPLELREQAEFQSNWKELNEEGLAKIAADVGQVIQRVRAIHPLLLFNAGYAAA